MSARRRAIVSHAGKMLEKFMFAVRGKQPLAPLAGLEIVGFTRSDPAARQTASQDWNIPGFADPVEAANATGADLLIDLGVSGLRAQTIARVLREAKSIQAAIGEKPIGCNIPQICQLITASRETRKPVFGIFQKRCAPVIAALIDALKLGRFGEIDTCRFETSVNWFRKPEYYAPPNDWHGSWRLDGGGAAMNQGIHYLDLPGYVYSQASDLAVDQSPFATVWATTSNRIHTGIQAEDTIEGGYRFTGGAEGAFFATTAAQPEGDAQLRVLGSNGARVVITEDRLTEWKFPEAAPGDEDLLRACGGIL